MAFEYLNPGHNETTHSSFNPLFVGVWLLNDDTVILRFVLSKFQPFICWSVAFEWRYADNAVKFMRVSTLYLLECGF